MKLEVLTVSIEAITKLRPIVYRIRRHDRVLAKQVTDAANSVVLNVAKALIMTPAHARAATSRRRAARTKYASGFSRPSLGDM